MDTDYLKHTESKVTSESKMFFPRFNYDAPSVTMETHFKRGRNDGDGDVRRSKKRWLLYKEKRQKGRKYLRKLNLTDPEQ